jgi:hypothetical protein
MSRGVLLTYVTIGDMDSQMAKKMQGVETPCIFSRLGSRLNDLL